MTQFHDYFGLEKASGGTGVVFVSLHRTEIDDTSAGSILTWLGDLHGRLGMRFRPQHLAA